MSKLGEGVFNVGSTAAVVDGLLLWLGLGLLREEGLSLLWLWWSRSVSIRDAVGSAVGNSICGAIRSMAGSRLITIGGAIGVDGLILVLIEADLGGESPEHFARHGVC